MFGVATLMATRSTCLRKAVGCVVTDTDGFVLSTGYNGAPKGMPHCSKVGCLIDGDHCVRSLHAEVNAVITAGKNGVSLEGATLYSTTRPCLRCTQILIQAGIRRVVFGQAYDSDDAQAAILLCSEAGIVVERLG